MPVITVLPALAVARFDTAVDWYERLLGRPADGAPMEGVVEWRFDGSASLQLVHDPEHTGGGRVTLVVDDIERHVAGLAERGLQAGPVDPEAEEARTATIVDPEGNQIIFAQPVAPE